MSKRQEASEETTELIRTMLIVQLGLAGVPQANIRSIAGCDMNRVNEILKQLNTKKTSGKEKKQPARSGKPKQPQKLEPDPGLLSSDAS